MQNDNDEGFDLDETVERRGRVVGAETADANCKYNEIRRGTSSFRVAATKLRREDEIILYGTRLLTVTK